MATPDRRSIKLVAVGWTAIRVLDRYIAILPDQTYIAAAADAVVLMNSKASNKLMLWLDPATKGWVSTDVSDGHGRPDSLGSLVASGDVTILITGFGQDEEAGYLDGLVREVKDAGGTPLVIGTRPQGRGHQEESERAASQLSALESHASHVVTVPFDRDYFVASAQADMLIVDLYQLVDSMVHRAVDKTVRYLEHLNTRELNMVQFTSAVNQYCRQFNRLLEC